MTRRPANNHARNMSTDAERGDYYDPSAGKVRFGDVARRWLAARIVDPSAEIRYESVHRLHVGYVTDRTRCGTSTPLWPSPTA